MEASSCIHERQAADLLAGVFQEAQFREALENRDFGYHAIENLSAKNLFSDS